MVRKNTHAVSPLKGSHAESVRRGEHSKVAKEEPYRQSFEQNPSPMWIFDDETLSFLEVNEAALRLYGWSRRAFLQMTAKDIRPRADVPRFIQLMRGLRKSRKPFVGQFKHVKQDGSLFDAAVTISCLRFQNRDARLTMVKDVTERKRAEEALQQSEERFQRLSDANIIGIVTANLDTILSANDEFLRMVGYSRSDLERGRIDWRRITPPEYAARDREAITQLRQQGWCEPFEKSYIRKSGSRVPILIGASLLVREPFSCICFVFDLTARQRVEEALRASEKRYRSVFENDITGDYVAKPDGQILLCNASFAAIFGFRSAKAVVGQNLAALQSQTDSWPDFVRYLKKRRRLLRHERTACRRDGKAIHVIETVVGMFNEQGDLVQLQGYVMDDTLRKQAEIALKTLNATLEERVAKRTEQLTDANECLHAVMDTALIGILTLNGSGEIESFNPAALQIFGYGPQEMMDRSVSRLLASPGQAQGEEFLAHYLSTNRQQFMGTRREVLGRRKDGQRLMLELTLTDITQRGRRQFVVMVRDVTERKRLERELLEIGERERQSIGNDLHDGLGQHLHGLFYLATLLEKGLQDDASPRAREAGQLSNHLKEALQLMRGVAHGLQPVNAVPEGLMLALRELAERTRSLYRVDCRFECRTRVLIHRQSATTHLYRIVQEALNNATKHARSTHILIQLAATPQGVVLRVRDNGIGIGRQTRIRKGMGLHIMQYRADVIGAQLAVQRHPRGGTEVVCTVPRPALLSQEEDRE